MLSNLKKTKILGPEKDDIGSMLVMVGLIALSTYFSCNEILKCLPLKWSTERFLTHTKGLDCECPQQEALV